MCAIIKGNWRFYCVAEYGKLNKGHFMEFFGFKASRQIVCFFVFCFFYLLPDAAVSAKVVFKKDPNQALSMHMLRIAKEAYDAGDYYEAKRIWMQVRAISPALEEPAWLKNPAPTTISEPSDLTWDRQKLILAIDQQGFTHETIKRAQTWIKEHPEDRLIRLLLLGHAVLIDNQAEITRHKTLLLKNKSEPKLLIIIVKILLAIIILALIVWQVSKLKKEFSQK